VDDDGDTHVYVLVVLDDGVGDAEEVGAFRGLEAEAARGE